VHLLSERDGLLLRYVGERFRVVRKQRRFDFRLEMLAAVGEEWRHARRIGLSVIQTELRETNPDGPAKHLNLILGSDSVHELEVAAKRMSGFKRKRLQAARNTFVLICQLPFFPEPKEEFLTVAPP